MGEVGTRNLAQLLNPMGLQSSWLQEYWSQVKTGKNILPQESSQAAQCSQSQWLPFHWKGSLAEETRASVPCDSSAESVCPWNPIEDPSSPEGLPEGRGT